MLGFVSVAAGYRLSSACAAAFSHSLENPQRAYSLAGG